MTNDKPYEAGSLEHDLYEDAQWRLRLAQEIHAPRDTPLYMEYEGLFRITPGAAAIGKLVIGPIIEWWRRRFPETVP